MAAACDDGQRLRIEQLEREPGHFVGLGEAADHGIVPGSGVTETLSVSLARALVLGSDALWFTPPSAAAGDLAAGTLVRLRVDTAGTEEPVGLLLRTDTPPSSALAALLAALRAEGSARRGNAQRRRRVATPPTTTRPASSKA